MKAGVVHAKNDIRYEEIQKPEVEPGKVLIKVNLRVRYPAGKRRCLPLFSECARS